MRDGAELAAAAELLRVLRRFPRSAWPSLALVVDAGGVRATSRGELAAAFRAADLHVVADAIARVKRHELAAWLDLDDDEDPELVAVDARGRVRVIAIGGGR